MSFRWCLAGLLLRGSSGGAGVVLEEFQLWLLCFSLKNGSSYKTFGMALFEEPKRSLAKQALSLLFHVTSILLWNM